MLFSLVSFFCYSQNRIGISFQNIFLNTLEENELVNSQSINSQSIESTINFNLGLVYERKAFEFRIGFEDKEWKLTDTESNALYKTNRAVLNKQQLSNIMISKLFNVEIFKRVSLKYGPMLKMAYYFKDEEIIITKELNTDTNAMTLIKKSSMSSDYLTYSVGLHAGIVLEFKRFLLGLEVFNFLTYSPNISTFKSKEIKYDNNIEGNDSNGMSNRISLDKNIVNLTIFYNL